MEGVTTMAYAGLKAYWRRRSYRRLNRATDQTDPDSIKLGSGRRRGSSRFRIRRPRLKLSGFKFRLGSVRKFFLRIRDAYVSAMLGVASRGVYVSGYGGVAAGVFGGGGGGGVGMVKEYDEKMLVEIYNRIVLAQKQQQHQQGMAIADGRKFGPEVAPVCLFH